MTKLLFLDRVFYLNNERLNKDDVIVVEFDNGKVKNCCAFSNEIGYIPISKFKLSTVLIKRVLKNGIDVMEV